MVWFSWLDVACVGTFMCHRAVTKKRKHDAKTGKISWEGGSGDGSSSSMSAAVGEARTRLESPALDPETEKSIHKITDYSPNAGRYVRQQRLQLIIKQGRNTILKVPISAYQVLQHRDQFDTRDSDERKLLVESDETTLVVIATQHDAKNIIGRSFRKQGAEPISTLDDTLRKAAGLAKGTAPT